MRVIGHHAVREDCEVLDCRSTPKLRGCLFGNLWVFEDRKTVA
jgi:hypothetical protein